MSLSHICVPPPVLLEFPSQKTWPRTLGLGGAHVPVGGPPGPQAASVPALCPPGDGTWVRPAGGVLTAVT